SSVLVEGRLSIGRPFSSWYCGAPRPLPPPPRPPGAPRPSAGGPGGCCAIREPLTVTSALMKQIRNRFIVRILSVCHPALTSRLTSDYPYPWALTAPRTRTQIIIDIRP